MWDAMSSLVRAVPARPRREQSPAEELANGLSHGLALVAALVGGPYLIVQAIRRADAAFVVGTAIFFATVVVLYLASTLYLLMGWLVVLAVDLLFTRMPAAGLLWLLAGRLFYTAGVPFYATDSRLYFGHLIWHLFVVAGTTCHYFAVLWYAA
jgi:predicted membrane channel-forming protein YqfA (hemolysin III family)